jgi:hypothetical protein
VTLHQREKLASYACYQSETQPGAFERQPRRVGSFSQD